LREHDDAGAGVAFSNLFGRLDPLPLEGGRHPDVGDDHLWRRPFGAGHEFVVVAGDPHHLHIGGAADQGPNTLPHDQVVVGQEYGNLLARHAPIFERQPARLVKGGSHEILWDAGSPLAGG